MKTNRNSKIKKNKSNFWDILSQINNKEKRQEIEELGYNPSEQRAVGKKLSNLLCKQIFLVD